MSELNGYVKLYRCTLDNPVVCKDAEHFAVWCYLLLKATHKETDMLFNGKRITLEPGQLITGRKAISKKLDINESKVKRILICFENDQQIVRERGNRNSLVSIVNWEKYQQNDQQNDQQVTSKWPASDQQVTTNKNVKNKKNNKNIYGDFFEQLWQLYPIKKGKGSVSDSQKKKLYSIGLEEMTRAINRYCEENKETDKKFWKHGSTFFNSGYVDYLDTNYKEEPQESTTTRRIEMR